MVYTEAFESVYTMYDNQIRVIGIYHLFGLKNFKILSISYFEIF
jgi:hypothetical protein